MARTRHKRQFGHIQPLPSGRFRARYQASDGVRHNAPTTFTARIDAEAWLAAEQRLIERGEWSPPALRKAAARARRASDPTFSEYADQWLAHRPIRGRTRDGYRALLKNNLKPTFGNIAITQITPPLVREWHAGFNPKTKTLRSHAYRLLRTILGTAVQDELIRANPCQIRGAGSTKRSKVIRVANYDEIEALAGAMPENRRALVLISAWCGLRFGEATGLRRKDVDLKKRIVRVTQAVSREDGKKVVGPPKSDAGVRDVAIPPHILPALEEHLRVHVEPGREALLFPASSGGYLSSSSLYGRKPTKKKPGSGFYAARASIGRPDLRWHDLRHTGATLAARAGATQADLMARLGHSTPQASMIYQHAAAERDQSLAAMMSAMTEASAGADAG